VSDRASHAGAVSEADAATFEVVRPRLFGIACRVLRGHTEAEDVVQDTWIRWHRTDRREVLNSGAFLATATTRLAINAAHSARARHETPSGASLPEPIDPSADPTAALERNEELELAVRALLEKLSPTERAVFVLRDAFDYPYRQISELLELSEANARQLLVRARARLCGERRRPARGSDQRRLLAAFTTASETADLAELEQLLADEVAASRPLAVAA
jgi:RNA polymerase sigma factor (sigma-70 family)